MSLVTNTACNPTVQEEKVDLADPRSGLHGLDDDAARGRRRRRREEQQERHRLLLRQHCQRRLPCQGKIKNHRGLKSVAKLKIISVTFYHNARIVEYITKDCPSCIKVVIMVAPGIGCSAATGSGYQVVVLAVEAE